MNVNSRAIVADFEARLEAISTGSFTIEEYEAAKKAPVYCIAKKSCLKKNAAAPNDDATEVTEAVRKACEKRFEAPHYLTHLAWKNGQHERHGKEAAFARFTNMFIAGVFADKKEEPSEKPTKLTFAPQAKRVAFDQNEAVEATEDAVKTDESTKPDRGIVRHYGRAKTYLSFEQLAQYADENFSISLKHLLNAFELFVVSQSRFTVCPAFNTALQQYIEHAKSEKMTLSQDGFQDYCLKDFELQKTVVQKAAAQEAVARGVEDVINLLENYELTLEEHSLTAIKDTILHLFENQHAQKVLAKFFEQQNALHEAAASEPTPAQ